MMSNPAESVPSVAASGQEREIKRRAPGGGMKAVDGVQGAKRHNVMLDEASLSIMLKIGDGNLSVGVREAARRLKESGDTGAFSQKRREQR